MTDGPLAIDRDLIAHRLPGRAPDAGLVHLTMMRLGRLVERDLQQLLRPDGIERSEHSVMTTLWFAGPPHQLSPTRLSEIVVQTTSGMTKTLRRLEQHGLVERVANPADARSQLIALTDKGHDVVERHLHELVARWEDRLDTYTRREREQLITTLGRLLEVVDARPDGGH